MVGSSWGSYSGQLPFDGEKARFTALVGATGEIIGLLSGAELAMAHLSDVISAVDTIDFALWWANAKTAAAQSTDQIPALLHDGKPTPTLVDIKITCVEDRDEYLVFCVPNATHQNALIRSLQAVGVAVSQLDLDSVMAAVRENVVVLLELDSFFIALVDSETGDIALREVYEEGVLLPDVIKAAKGGLITWCVETQSSLMIRDSLEESLPITPHYMGNDREVRSIMMVPLTVQQKIVGVISVQSYTPFAFYDEDFWLLQSVAGQTALAIHNAKLYEQTSAQLTMLKALHSVGRAVARLDLDGVLVSVRKNVVQQMTLDSFFMAIVDEATGHYHFHELYENGVILNDILLVPEGGLVEWVITSQSSLMIRDSYEESLPVEPQKVGDTKYARSLMMVPLMVQQKVVGVISIQSYEPHAFSDDDFWLLSGIAGQVSVAIQNAGLYQQTVSQLSMLAALQHVGMELSSANDRSQLADVLCGSLMDLMSPDEVHVFLYHQYDSALHFIAGRGADGSITDSTLKPYALVLHADAGGDTLFVSDGAEYTQLLDDLPWRPSSFAVLPLVRSDQRYGVVAMLYREPHIFDYEAKRILNLFGQQIAIAAENMMYFDDLVRRFEEVSALYSLAQQITGELNTAQILNMVVYTLRGIFRCRACAIALRSPENGDIAYAASVGIPDDQLEMIHGRLATGYTGQVIASGKSIYIADRQVNATPTIAPEARSMLAVPIRFKNVVIGSLNLDSVSVNAFSADHERILTIAAAQVAAALENARLYQEEAEHVEDLKHANEALAQLDRMREELVQNLAHELRNPLTFVKGYAELMLEGDFGELNESQLEALGLITLKASVIQHLIDDVVAMEMVDEDSLDLELLEVNELAQVAMDSVLILPKSAQRHFEIALDADQCWIKADHGRISQVLDNLLGNALKFTPEGGRVTLRTSRPDEAHVQFVVADTGIGIVADELPRVFDRFYQVQDPARVGIGGSGIGLAIVKRVVEAHGGTVSVESVQGQGSTFTVTLPCLERPIDDSG